MRGLLGKQLKIKQKETKQEITKESMEERVRGNETLMETDRREGCWETHRQDANMMSSSFC